MIKSAIHRWDAVDVRMENGTKQFGYVVDMDNNDHIMIDCGNGAPVCIPSCRIHQPGTSSITTRAEIRRSGVLMQKHEYKWEAVVQSSPDAPYTWHPTRLLLHNDDMQFILVEILINNQQQEYVLPLDHIRRSYSSESDLNCRTAFRKMRTPVPEEFILDDRVRKLWMEQVPQRKITDLKEGFLYYLREKKREAEETPANQLRLLEKTLELLQHEPNSVDRFAKFPQGDGEWPDINKTIPREILLKIFKFLDTEQQSRARRVCTKWNTLLHFPQIVKEVRIHCPKEIEQEEPEACRKIAAFVHKNLSARTQKLTLTGSGHWQVFDILQDFRDICRAVPPETLVLLDWELPFFHCFDSHPVLRDGIPVFEFSQFYGEFCRYLVFDNVTVADISCDFISEPDNNDYLEPVPVNCLSIHIVSGRIDMQSPSRSSDFWDLLERYCPSVDHESSIVPAAFQSAKVMDPDDDDEHALWMWINQILYGFESCDPRASKERRSMFKMNEFPDFSAINARNLNKLTLYILDKVFRENYRPLLGKFAAEPDDMEDDILPL